MDEDALSLSFDPMTIEHLGSNMYSRLPNAVAELVANAYDADAGRIEVRIHGHGGSQAITVTDDGHGMSREDLAEKYLRIGRNRRGEDVHARSESGDRRVSGKKGLGKLALFGIGSIVEVRTKRKGTPEGTAITLAWNAIRSSKTPTYQPAESSFAEAPDKHGTTVTIRSLERKTDVRAADLASSLSGLFNYADADLTVIVVAQNGEEYPIDATTRLNGVDAEFEWSVPYAEILETDRLLSLGVTGRVVAARKPLRTHLRGITVYANSRLANEPEFFGASDSSFAYAYLTGYVEIDRLDDITPDVIATDRRTVNWDTPESAPFRDALKRMVEQIAVDRRRRRDEAREKKTVERTGHRSSDWQDTIKGPERESVSAVLSVLSSEEADLPDSVVEKAVDGLYELAPPYADMFWRHLHPVVQDAAEQPYREGRYLEAVVEAFKGFVALTRKLSGLDDKEDSLWGKAYGRGDNTAIKILSPYDITQLAQQTIDSMEDGQRELAKAIASAFRNPPSHHTYKLIESLGLYSYQDCLDALSMISHLCRRASAAVQSQNAVLPDAAASSD